MGKVYFKVLTKTEDIRKEVSIRIRYKDGKIDQATSTGESVQLQHWDLDKQKLKRTSFNGKDNLISRLKKLEGYVLDQAAKTDLFESGWLLSIVDQYLHPIKYLKKGDQSMFEWIETWISKSENTYHAIRPYHSVLNDLREFRPELVWKNLDMEFYYDFVSYLIEKNYSKNTIGSRIKNLKVFCNASLERGIHDNTTFKNFKKLTEDSFNIYLNEDELSSIFALDLSENPHLDRVRDIFLIGCWTGCRFSDLYKLNKDNINGDNIHLEQQKTQQRVIIPLHPIVKSILKKYDGNFPEKISNQKYNDYIKKVCEKAEFSGKISKSITKGGKRITEVKEKWEMVSSHTARRSFATNLYKSGFPSIGIMAMTGHSTEKAFLSYIKVNEEEHAEMLMKHWDKIMDNKKELLSEITPS
jgi:integrase